MPNIKTRKGAYRYIIFGHSNVYKFPAFRYAAGVIKSMPKMLLSGDGKFIWQELRWGWRNFIRGIRENWSEYQCWKRMHTPFLVPTRFSLFGFLNIQKFQAGQEPSREEMAAIFSKLPPLAQREMSQVESHCLEPGNFVKTSYGYALVDYDNGTTPAADRYPFTIFLEKWHNELENILIPKIKQSNR